MFSDRFWTLKVAAALGLFAWICFDSRRVISFVHPEIETAALPMTKGKTMIVAARPTIAADASSFEVDTNAGPVRILTPHPPPVGEYVTVVGRVVGIRTLEAVSVHVSEGHRWKRPLNYAVSIATVLGYFWIIRRRFRWDPRGGVLRGRY